MNPLLSTNVPDPTDFPPRSVAPGLRELDASLRCNICGEVYDGPVTLNCGHSFCSQCIRSSLAEKQECPTCRKTAIEGHIRPNSVVEEIISNWNISRPYLLDLIKQKDEWKRDSTPITPKAKKRKVSPETENRRRVSTSTLASPSKHKRIKQSSSILFATIPTSDAEEDELREPDKEPGLDDQVDCPLCGKRVKFKTINLHMDKGCKDSPPISVKSTTSTSDWKKLMAKPSATTKGKQKDNNDSTNDDYPLPKASYDTLKDKKIKEMLVEYGLPTSGDRNLWIQRHQRWVILYNSNLDKSAKNRKSKDELKRDLRKWEEERPKKKKTTVEDTVAHVKKHTSEFARLVEAAKPRVDRVGGSSSSVGEKLLPEGSGGADGKPHAVSTQKSRVRAEEDDTIVLDSEEE